MSKYAHVILNKVTRRVFLRPPKVTLPGFGGCSDWGWAEDDPASR